MNATATDTSPESLRDAMITKIKDDGYTLSPTIEQALRAVERHLFVPDATLEEAYENDIVVTKRGADDQVLSCLSQPSIVALQLGQMEVQPGHRVLEIGAGAGYNAALLAHLAGPHGHVTAIDVDADIVDQARERVAAAGVSNVEVVLGDSALGHEPGAPFDRIVATVGAYGIPDAWLAQLAPTGRLVVPARFPVKLTC
jgi:protein-L-isoaspartate(D-aspartate) O-methyltransferase